MILPTFQPQNPALNGYSLGWLSCTAYSGAMAAAFHRQVKFVMSGEALRRKTGDTTGGLNLAQIDTALNAGWSIDLGTYYRLSWATFEKFIDAGMGAVLQGLYAPIADSRFDAGRGFRGNHAIFVPPRWGVMDPLADGRYGQAYKYQGEAYPRSLLRSFAGKLDLGGRPLGDGYVYCAVTKDNVHSYRVHVGPGRFWVYSLANGVITGRMAREFSREVVLRCTAPRLYPWPGNTSRTLVRVIHPGSSLDVKYLAIPQSAVKLELVP